MFLTIITTSMNKVLIQTCYKSNQSESSEVTRSRKGEVQDPDKP